MMLQMLSKQMFFGVTIDCTYTGMDVRMRTHAHTHMRTHTHTHKQLIGCICLRSVHEEHMFVI